MISVLDIEGVAKVAIAAGDKAMPGIS